MDSITEAAALVWDNYVYECNCSISVGDKKTHKHKGYEKIGKIKKTKVNYISMCESMGIVESDSDQEIVIKINYDIIAQLEMILFNYSEVNYRDKEIEKVKKILMNQSLLPKISIETFLSNNPACLINEFLKADFSDKKFGIYQAKMQELQLNCANTSVFGECVEKDAVKYKHKASEFVKSNIGLVYKLDKLLKKKSLPDSCNAKIES